jgi:hypothetical protein
MISLHGNHGADKISAHGSYACIPELVQHGVRSTIRSLENFFVALAWAAQSTPKTPSSPKQSERMTSVTMPLRIEPANNPATEQWSKATQDMFLRTQHAGQQCWPHLFPPCRA